MSAELLSRVSIPFDSVDLTLTGDLEFDDENHTLVLWTDEGIEVLSTCSAQSWPGTAARCCLDQELVRAQRLGDSAR